MNTPLFNNKGQRMDKEMPLLMGIVNVTPDSFYSNSRIESKDMLLSRVSEMVAQGVDILDIGGQSTRPGATRVSEAEEMERVAYAIAMIHKEFSHINMSIDTFYASVANEALKQGATIVNDVTAGMFDPEMLEVVASHKAIFIAMHMRGTPQTMHQDTNYEDIGREVAFYLEQRRQVCLEKGILDVWIDPGFGFAKTIAQNYTLLKQLPFLGSLINAPIVVGVSRKSMLWKPLQITPEESLCATTALHLYALQKGASILRVHDVKEAKQAIQLHTLLST
jgi:dihydropteroate synthase